MKMILVGVGFMTAITAMLAMTLKSVTWILEAIEWIGIWMTDWRDEWFKWEGR